MASGQLRAARNSYALPSAGICNRLHEGSHPESIQLSQHAWDSSCEVTCRSCRRLKTFRRATWFAGDAAHRVCAGCYSQPQRALVDQSGSRAAVSSIPLVPIYRSEQAMPRTDSQGLRNISADVPRKDAMREALGERPLVTRVYGDGLALERLRQRLRATEQWASRLDASVPTRLMVAATISPRDIADVFDDLAAACHEAAPPATKVAPSIDIEAWSTKPASDATRADRLIHVLSLLGEHVAGCWSWVPSMSPVGPDGVIDEDVAWELEYSPPPTNLLEVIGSRGVLEGATLQEAMLDDQHLARSSRIHSDVLRLAASAIDELQEKAFATHGRFGTQDISMVLETRGMDVVRIHNDLASVVSDIQAATREEGGSSRWAWARLHERLVTGFDIWIDRVLPATPLDRIKRQSVKRDMPRWVGYVAQYSLLLRGNAASHELLRMVGYVKHVCRALGEVIDAMLGNVQPSANNHADRVRRDGLLVSKDTEERWRQMLGTKARGIGRLIATVVGEVGQQGAVPQRELLRMADAAALLTAQAASSRAGCMEALLLRMQLCGLAVKIPVAVFRESTGGARGAAERRRIHVARDWWLNPLGAVLSSKRT